MITNTRRKPPTCRKSLKNFIKQCYIEYTWLQRFSKPKISHSEMMQHIGTRIPTCGMIPPFSHKTIILLFISTLIPFTPLYNVDLVIDSASIFYWNLDVSRLYGIFWMCPDCVVYFGCVPTVWYILDVSRLCGIFWMCPDCVVYFGSVPTVWYILFFIFLF